VVHGHAQRVGQRHDLGVRFNARAVPEEVHGLVIRLQAIQLQRRWRCDVQQPVSAFGTRLVLDFKMPNTLAIHAPLHMRAGAAREQACGYSERCEDDKGQATIRAAESVGGLAPPSERRKRSNEAPAPSFAPRPKRRHKEGHVHKVNRQHGLVLIELQAHQGIDPAMHHDGRHAEKKSQTARAHTHKDKGLDEDPMSKITAISIGCSSIQTTPGGSTA